MAKPHLTCSPRSLSSTSMWMKQRRAARRLARQQPYKPTEGPASNKALSASERAEYLQDLLIEELRLSRDQFHSDCQRHETTIESKTSQILGLKDDVRKLSDELSGFKGAHWLRRSFIGLAAFLGACGTVLMARFPPGSTATIVGLNAEAAFGCGVALNLIAAAITAVLAYRT